MTDPAVLAALRAALEGNPRNGPLWMHYAELCEAAGDPDEAVRALRNAVELEGTEDAALRRLAPLLRRRGELDEALIRIERRLARGEDAELRAELERVQEARGRGGETTMPGEDERREALAGVAPEPADESWAAQFDWGGLRVTFDDVVGLEDVKRQIRLRIIAPFQKPDVYRAFGREAGGGLLLYGPPGCGKTYLARATAGELGARFTSVSLHEVVDKYWGESEKLVHRIFEDARRSSPTVLFFDEFDALGVSRGGHSSAFWSTLVNQMLQEMDGMEGRAGDVLVMAATNMPWKVDPAFRRPGRFDRVLFVTPPDEAARARLLERSFTRVPGGEVVDCAAAARRTELWTGADLRALCERATEAALERSLESGAIQSIAQADVDRAVSSGASTASEWIATARNYARYSNEGQYDELVTWLKAIRRW